MERKVVENDLRRELRKLPTPRLREAYDNLKAGKSTGIDILERHKAYALDAVKEILWERGKWGRTPAIRDRMMQSDLICRACGGPLSSISKTTRKERFRCQHCGREVSREAGQRLAQTIPIYRTPASKLVDVLERLWRAGDTKEFYKVLGNVKDAIKERERGKIKKLPDISLTDLRNIVKQADRLYR